MKSSKSDFVGLYFRALPIVGTSQDFIWGSCVLNCFGWVIHITQVGIWVRVSIAVISSVEIMTSSEGWSIWWVIIDSIGAGNLWELYLFCEREQECLVISDVVLSIGPLLWCITTECLSVSGRFHETDSGTLAVGFTVECASTESISGSSV